MKIPFGEFAPDSAAINRDVATVAENVIVDGQNYKSLPGLTTEATWTLSSGLATSMFAPIRVGGLSNAIYTYGSDCYLHGTALNAGARNIAKVGGYPFALWSDNKLLFAGEGITTPFATTIGSTSITALGGTPPEQPRTCAVVNNFLVMGCIKDASPGSTERYNRVHWSGFNDYNHWTVGVNQCDFNDLPDSSNVMRIIPIDGNSAVIFQVTSITRMTYVGAPLIFQFELIEDTNGCISSASVVNVGNDIYYLSNSGFRVLRGGVSQSIGVGKIDKWFFNNLYCINQYTLNDASSVMGAVDFTTNNIFWAFRSQDSSLDATFSTNNKYRDKCLIFNINENKWTVLDRWNSPTSAAVITGICSRITNAIPARLTEGISSIGVAFINHDRFVSSSDYYLTNFNDGESALPAIIETGEFSQDDALTEITEIRPIIDGITTVTTETRNLLSDSVTSTGPTSTDSTGKANVRTNARYTRIKCTTSGDFTEATGVEVKLKKGGRR